jgi:hypothetical protein
MLQHKIEINVWRIGAKAMKIKNDEIMPAYQITHRFIHGVDRVHLGHFTSSLLPARIR